MVLFTIELSNLDLSQFASVVPVSKSGSAWSFRQTSCLFCHNSKINFFFMKHIPVSYALLC